MIGSLAIMLLGAAAPATPCESLASLRLDRTSITSAQLVPEGPAPARGRGRGAPGAPPAASAQAARAGGAPNAARGNAPPAMIPEHCRLQLVLAPSADSHIEMEMWLPPMDKWNGKFMGVGNGGFAGSIQGLANDMPQALRLGYATAGTDTGHQDPGGAWAIGHPEKMIDFGYRATHEMTLKAKQIVKAFYDRSAQYLVLQRLLDRRTHGAHGGPAIPARLRRHHRRLAREPSHSHVDRRSRAQHQSVASSGRRDLDGEGGARQQPRDEHLRHAEGRLPEQSAAVQGGLLVAEVPRREPGRKRRGLLPHGRAD